MIDTNVFLVMLASRHRLHWIYKALQAEAFQLCVSNEILSEYEEIIQRRLGITRTESMLRYLLMRPNVRHIEPTYRWRLLKDEDDNKFVDCAVAANAHCIVSNDRGFRQLINIEFPPVKVLTSDEFTQTYRSSLEP